MKVYLAYFRNTAKVNDHAGNKGYNYALGFLKAG
jgi:hypothetical protein